MKHNQHLPDEYFQQPPQPFNKFSEKSILQNSLGGTLYMPGTRKIIDKLIQKELPELKSMVMCLEDAVPEQDLELAEENIIYHLESLYEAIQQGDLTIDEIPLIFIRARNTEQFLNFSNKITKKTAYVLTGFVFPKFYSYNANIYLEKLKQINLKLDSKLYAMPILEGKTIAYRESRSKELEKLKLILDPYQEQILNIRIGGTDFSSLFGVRRSMHSTVYDILPVRDAISDILNFFNRMEDSYTVSAPVWEYFLAYKKDDLLKYMRDDIHRSLLTKEPILNDAIDGLLREVVQDKANGMVGKTVIHPSHLRFVNAMQAVTLEEYEDAIQILETHGGVIKSRNGNKMNEIAPHRNWAKRITLRAQAYGVINDESEYMRLFLSPVDKQH
ncbi:HpcH/HpaI aldolase/citrate lyase family protein [Vreelandella nigrificans]|uniref:ATP/GTP-binding protein n=1 Tax=Vreelandella nigrificans TaxID=2042704 RepID=A0A2A4HQG7_9GAMM|nr:HpcH/HpaI aldolase/citrate lyase family protein [Halomonas nigrificans]PCF96485.1 ATP/GTP-binding protein [Halomonas nigrificans]